MSGTAELNQLMTSLQRVVAVAPHQPGWRTELGEGLRTLRRAFAEHVGATEGPDGLYLQLVQDAPRLAAGVDGLLRQHRDLLRAMEGLHARVAAEPDRPAEPVTPPGPVAPAQREGGAPLVTPDELRLVREWARELLRELNEHRQRGADLVHEAYGTDLGGET